MSVLYLTEDDVRRLLTMDAALSAVEAAFRKMALDEAENVPRRRCQTDHVMLHVLPAAAKTLNAIGFKAYTTTRPDDGGGCRVIACSDTENGSAKTATSSGTESGTANNMLSCAGISSASVLSARRSLGSLNVGTSTTPLAM